MRSAVRRLVDLVAAITDPVERARAATGAIDDLSAAVGELSSLRREGLLALVSQGWTHRQIAAHLGVTRARVTNMLRAPGIPVGRQFLATGAMSTVVIAVGGQQETGHRRAGDQPVVSTATMAAVDRLADLARGVGLEPDVEAVDLNRADLVVASPRLLPWVGQVQAADPWYRFAVDDDGWHLVDLDRGVTYRSPIDTGGDEDYAYLGRLPRPSGRGTFVYVAGIHAQGTLGAAVYLASHLAELHHTYRRRRFSMLLRTRVTGVEVDTVDVLAPARAHKSAV